MNLRLKRICLFFLATMLICFIYKKLTVQIANVHKFSVLLDHKVWSCSCLDSHG